MRAIIQRVTEASVKIEGSIHNQISNGLMVLLGIEDADSHQDASWIIRKISQMRIFNDESGVMNKSLLDIQGEILIISQFTLFASTRKGNRPSYIQAAKPEVAIPIYHNFLEQWEKETAIQPKAGIFGADMKVKLVNDGPVTISIDSKNKA
ncbi:D-aminoacyl-tRNA deacylase [Portibacter marinus]|uniref:D-aminoacyl-tRNA deacylase n=1 Tax=Portibacter marinus TaxID=2898660 RepID=UPI001F2A66F1|nr:D-aminoacyl-tRNA deacylase [Portibacter marinus]